MENEWTKTLDCMRQTLKEREEFIQSVISDNVKLEAENNKLADLVTLLTTRKGNHAD
jgi:hypothetical protein